jgi:FtsZ-binding cell division protein ZapB
VTAAITKAIVDFAPYLAGIASTVIAFMTYHEGKRKNRHDELEDMNDRLRADNDRLRRENERLRKENNHE